MPETPDALLPLWDYGWCEHRIIKCADDPSNGIVESYLRCEQFGNSFVFPEPGVDSTLHGPFRRTALLSSHFAPVSLSEILTKLREICFHSPDTKAVSLEQWNALECLAKTLIDRNEFAFQLTLTVKDTEAKHEWDWVILDFYEFIFVSHGSGTIERLVIGNDTPAT